MRRFALAVVAAMTIITGLVQVSAAAQTPQQAIASAPKSFGPAQMRADLVFLRDVWGPKEASFTPETRATFRAIVDDLIARAPTLTPVDLSLGVSRAVASAGNGHTQARLGPYFHHLPFRAVWFSDGLFVVRTHPSQVALLGARIDRLGALTPEKALARVSPYISGNLQRKRLLSPDYLELLEVLQRIGATTSTDRVRLQVTLKDGSARTVELGPAPSRDPEFLPADQQLIRLENPLPPAPDVHGPWSMRWPHVLDALPQVPIAFQRSEILATAWLGNAADVLYIRSDQIKVPDPKTSADPIGEILRHRPRAVVLDLRFNSGGDFTQSFLLTQVLPRIMQGHRIYVLVGPGTFSAAIVTASMLKARGGRQVVLVGEPMGDNDAFWAEGRSMTLPNSGIDVHYATEFEDWGHGCSDLSRCFWLNVALADHPVSLQPEIEVRLSFEDYVSGRDAVLEAALRNATAHRGGGPQ